VARVKIRRNFACPVQCDRRRESRIRAQHPGPGRSLAVGFEVYDLGGRMNACIGPARTDRRHGMARDEAQRGLNGILNRRRVRLTLPAGKAGPVVLD